MSVWQLLQQSCDNPFVNTYFKPPKYFKFCQGRQVMNSTTNKPVIFVIAAVVAFGASVVSAQEKGGVAILDVAKVFKENRSGPLKIDAMKAEADQFKKQALAAQDRIKVEAMKLREIEASTKRNQMTADLKQQPTWHPTIRLCWASILKLANSFNVFALWLVKRICVKLLYRSDLPNRLGV